MTQKSNFWQDLLSDSENNSSRDSTETVKSAGSKSLIIPPLKSIDSEAIKKKFNWNLHVSGFS